MAAAITNVSLFNVGGRSAGGMEEDSSALSYMAYVYSSNNIVLLSMKRRKNI